MVVEGGILRLSNWGVVVLILGITLREVRTEGGAEGIPVCIVRAFELEPSKVSLAILGE